MKKYIIILSAIISTIPNVLIGQGVNLTDLPPDKANTRISNYQDTFPDKVVRPALTLRGFDSTRHPGGVNYGLGLKQILEKYLDGNAEIEQVIETLVSNSEKSLKTPTGSKDDQRIIIGENSRRTQARAFVALATYVLEKNGEDSVSNDIFGKTHLVAMDSLRTALTNPPGGKLVASELTTKYSWTDKKNALNMLINVNEVDPIHMVASLRNIAEAIDLYLAIENAYAYYISVGKENSMAPLLSLQERATLLNNFGSHLDNMNRLNELKFDDINSLFECDNSFLINMYCFAVKGIISVISGAGNTLPNDGWERLENRNFLADTTHIALAYTAFNNARRVARFVVDAGQRPIRQNGDLLQIRLNMDGRTQRSYPMMHVGNNAFETALQIPLDVDEVQWALLVNGEKVGDYEVGDVEINGTILNIKYD